MEKKESRKFEEFIEGSNTFNGFSFNGCYYMSRDIFFKLLNIYIETGENLLDDYSNYIYLRWENPSIHEPYYPIDKCDRVGQSLSNLRRHKIVDPEDLADQRAKIKEYRRINKYWQNKERLRPRIEACTHTSKKSVRKSVFDKYGEICLACGATENITIDHVIPVSKGGRNDISNYQPLCKSCNSKKMDKATDYRKKNNLVIHKMDDYAKN